MTHLSPRNAPPGVVAAFLTRRGGISPPPFDDLNVGTRVGDGEENIQENVNRICSEFALDRGRLCLLAQIHSDRVIAVPDSKSAERVEADGWVSNRPGWAFGIKTADCLPILAWDEGGKVVGAAHAGWKGTLAMIAGRLIATFGSAFAVRPKEIRCILGPAIGPCCYEVKDDLLSQVGEEGRAHVTRREDRSFLHLSAWNVEQLLEAGVARGAIEAIGLCTCCDRDRFFSNRRDGPRTGRQLSLIGML